MASCAGCVFRGYDGRDPVGAPAHSAYGMAGGEPGKVGRNWVERCDGSILQLGGADKSELMPGDVFVIETPGGGGTAWHRPDVV